MPDIYVAPKREVPEKKREEESPKRAIARLSRDAVKSLRKAGNAIERVRLGQTRNPLAAFVANPPDIRFETQERQERIILLLRRHWVTNLPWMLLMVLMIFAPLLLRFFPVLEFLPGRYQTMTVFLWYLLLIAFVFESFLSWYFNVDVVTDERIVDIDFCSLIYKEVSHCKIDQIQDVSFKMGGIVRTIFNYGDVLIQTAAEIPVFEFESVPQPALVVQKLNELILEEEQEKLEGRVR